MVGWKAKNEAMREKIIDFHVHPFVEEIENMCFYKQSMSFENDQFVADLKNSGITCCCGSVISSVGTKEDAISFIKEIVSEANVLLYKYTTDHEESAGMGTTIVLAIVTPTYLLFGNIGDSSGYVLRKNKLLGLSIY